MRRGRLADCTWPSVPAGALLLVPVGATEQHGPHLPLDTDSAIATAVAHRAHELLAVPRAAPVVVAPTLAFGASGEHQHFAGTCSIGTAALRSVVVELVRSARAWASRVVLVNGHGGNVAALTAAVAQLTEEGHDVDWLPCAAGDMDLHAGRSETSLMLHLDPARVHLDRAEAGNTRPLAELMPAMREGGVAAVSASGVLGDPRGADPGEGERLLEAMAAAVAARVRSRVPVAR